MGARMRANEAYKRALEDAYDNVGCNTDKAFKELANDIEQAIRTATYDGLFAVNQRTFDVESYTNEWEVNILRVIEATEYYFRNNGFRIRTHKYKQVEVDSRYSTDTVLRVVVSVDWSLPRKGLVKGEVH